MSSAIGKHDFASPAAGGEITSGATLGAQFLRDAPDSDAGATIVTTATARARINQAAYSTARYTKDAISSPDCYVQARVFMYAGGAGLAIRLFVRGATSDSDGYEFRINTNPNGYFYQRVGGTLTEFGSGLSLGLTVGGSKLYRMEVSGSDTTVTGTLYEDGIQILQITDTTSTRITRAGVAGIEIAGQATADGVGLEIDDFECGALPYSAGTSPTAGFTASVNQKVVTITDTSTAGSFAITGYDTDWDDGSAHMTTASGSHTYTDGVPTHTITHTVTDGITTANAVAHNATTKTRNTYDVVRNPGGETATVTADVPDA